MFKDERIKSDLVMSFLRQVQEIMKANNKGLLNFKQLIGRERECFMGQQPPLTNFFKINVDGAIRRVQDQGSYGGILKNNNGAFLGRFTLNIARCSIVEMEFQGIYHGLNLSGE